MPFLSFRHILELDVKELHQMWPQIMDAAVQNALASGREDIAEYLRLKASNDSIRIAAVGWLIDTFLEVVGNAMRDRPNLYVEREEPHTFSWGRSTMVGTLIDVKQGVRRLSMAAGWARTPDHGIMQNGALAFARFTHFGLPRDNAEYRLVQGAELPQWLNGAGAAIDSHELERHLAILLA